MILKILEKRIETDQIFSLILEKPASLHFYPGQYIDIELPINDNTTSDKLFTISSSPTEDFLMVTTKVGLSPFKKALGNLESGDIITTSHPAGTFTLDESTPAVFIAGGIGITPFRSMIKYAVDKKITTPITLIYSNSGSHFTFKDGLDLWQDKLPNLRIIYNQISVNGRLNKTKLDAAVQRFVAAIFYLAGPPGMVDEVAEILSDLGVDGINIRYDRFDGY